MLLVRHNRLAPPYDDYGALTAEMLDALACGGVSPGIQALPAVLPFGEDALAALRRAELFVCSESVRTQETCRAVMGALGISGQMRVDARLNEIAFTPSRLMEPGETPIGAVRSRLYPAIAAGRDGVEAAGVLEERMRGVLDDYGGRGVAAFTHGFLMRLLAAYARRGRAFSGALSLAGEIPSVGYLDTLVL